MLGRCATGSVALLANDLRTVVSVRALYKPLRITSWKAVLRGTSSASVPATFILEIQTDGQFHSRSHVPVLDDPSRRLCAYFDTAALVEPTSLSEIDRVYVPLFSGFVAGGPFAGEGIEVPFGAAFGIRILSPQMINVETFVYCSESD